MVINTGISEYFDNVTSTIVTANQYSLVYGDGKTWDNKKRKNTKRYMPRGKVFIRLERLQNQHLIKSVHEYIKNIGFKKNIVTTD